MPDEIQTIHRMTWFLLIVIIAWFFVAISATMLVFWLTKNPYSLSLFPALTSPVVSFLSWILKPLLPMNEKRFRLAEKKLEVQMRRSMEIKQGSFKNTPTGTG